MACSCAKGDSKGSVQEATLRYQVHTVHVHQYCIHNTIKTAYTIILFRKYTCRYHPQLLKIQSLGLTLFCQCRKRSKSWLLRNVTTPGMTSLSLYNHSSKKLRSLIRYTYRVYLQSHILFQKSATYTSHVRFLGELRQLARWMKV